MAKKNIEENEKKINNTVSKKPSKGEGTEKNKASKKPAGGEGAEKNKTSKKPAKGERAGRNTSSKKNAKGDGTERNTASGKSAKIDAADKNKKAAVKKKTSEGGAGIRKPAAGVEGKAKPSKTESTGKSAEKTGFAKKTAARKRREKQAPSVKIIPLGGLDKIGMNITAIETAEGIVVIDCGLSFPDESMLGIGKIIPDITYLSDNIEKVKAFVITHGHEDHIGAIPYVISQVNVPVCGTKLTIGLIEHKLEEAGLLDVTTRIVVNQGEEIEFGDIKVEFIRTNHSIVDAASLAITTPAGVIFHTGDFKIDYTPLFGDPIDLRRIAILGSKGVLAVMSDSTNAIRPGFTPSETMVANTFDNLFAQHTNNRIIVATFASNVDRVRQLILTAAKFGRKVIVQGRSMETVLSIASDLGYMKVPENTLISVDEMNNYPDKMLVFITTGSQGEAMAALSRMASSTHKKIAIKPGDAIVFSSNPIPGNEKAVSKVMNELAAKGAEVIYQDTHVSGHACSQELQLIYTLLKPKYAIPVHGEVRHLQAARELIAGTGINKENIFILNAGDVLKLSEHRAAIVGKVKAGEIFIDNTGSVDVDPAVIKDRQNLAEHGFVIISAAVESGTGFLLGKPQVISRGFVYLKDSEELIAELERAAAEAVNKCFDNETQGLNGIRSAIKSAVEEIIWKRTQRDPIILTSLIEI